MPKRSARQRDQIEALNKVNAFRDRGGVQMQMSMAGNASRAGNLPQHQEQQQQQEEVDSAKRKCMEEAEAMYDSNVRYLEEKRLRYTAELNSIVTKEQLEEETKRRQAAEAALQNERRAAQTAAATAKAEKEQLEEELKAVKETCRAEVADCKQQLQQFALLAALGGLPHIGGATSNNR